jgi:hypothetical protein
MMSTGLRNTTLRSPSKRKPRAAVDAKEVIKSEKSIPAKGEIILPSMLISMRIPIIKKSYDESYLDLHPNKIQTPVYTRRHPMYQMFKKKNCWYIYYRLRLFRLPTMTNCRDCALRGEGGG